MLLVATFAFSEMTIGEEASFPYIAIVLNSKLFFQTFCFWQALLDIGIKSFDIYHIEVGTIAMYQLDKRVGID